MIATVARSYLFVPGDSGRRLRLAHTRGADAVIVDLEDGVADNRKDEGRRQIAAWLDSEETSPVERWVRIRSGASGIEDLRSIFHANLDGVCLAKAEPGGVLHVARTLDELESAAPNRRSSVHVMPLLETAAALHSAAQIATMPRVLRLQLGEIDLAAELGMQPGADEQELLPFRALVVAATTQARLQPAVGAVWPDIPDAVGLERSTQRLRRLGYRGRAAIHPTQLEVIHRVFSPTAEELEHARRIIARYATAQESGIGVVMDERGRMIDEAVVRRSRALLGFDPAYDDKDRKP